MVLFLSPGCICYVPMFSSFWGAHKTPGRPFVQERRPAPDRPHGFLRQVLSCLQDLEALTQQAAMPCRAALHARGIRKKIQIGPAASQQVGFLDLDEVVVETYQKVSAGCVCVRMSML